jgi:hypothetical protein
MSENTEGKWRWSKREETGHITDIVRSGKLGITAATPDYLNELEDCKRRLAVAERGLELIARFPNDPLGRIAKDHLTAPSSDTGRKVCKWYPNDPCPLPNVHCQAPDCMVPTHD